MKASFPLDVLLCSVLAAHTKILSHCVQPAGLGTNFFLSSWSHFPSGKVSRLVAGLWSVAPKPFSAGPKNDHRPRQGA